MDHLIRKKIIENVQKAKQNGGLILYDPNIRKNHLPEIREMMHLVEENINLADIVRGSDEDFENLFGLKDSREVFEHLKKMGCDCLIITKGRNGAELWSENCRLKVRSKNIDVVSTIGAGDAFNAGIIYGLCTKGITVHDLVQIKEDLWKEILGFGITFASEVCQRFDNYISADFAVKLNERANQGDL
jgi:fructokinase